VKAPFLGDWTIPIVERRRLDTLKSSPRNARLHTEDQIQNVARSIREFGWTYPILIDPDGEIVAGHARAAAARLLGHVDVPVIVAAGWTEEQKTAYALADNRLAETSSWDRDMLAEVLGDLSDEGDAFDPTLTGFSHAEIDRILDPGKPLEVQEIATGPVEDQFWVSVRGPLKHQAAILQAIQGVSASLLDVEVDVGVLAFE
jgi:hypothetical protein